MNSIKNALLLIFFLSSNICFTGCKDPCKDIVCVNGGICVEGDCDCPDGFFGSTCATEDLCITQNITCQNDGVCVEGTCDCPDGFSGVNCDTEDRCITQNITCKNDGSCVDGVCDCLGGYIGNYCEVLEPKLEWERSYGGSGIDEASSIHQTTDGGYIVAGTSNSKDGDVGGNNGEQDFWILKLNREGNLEREKNYGEERIERASEIQQTTDGGYIIAGDYVPNGGDSDFWIVKLNSTGNLEWEKKYGGSWWEYANSVKQTNDGGFIVAGSARSDNGDVSENKGLDDVWIVKLDQSGNMEWEKSYGNSNTEKAYSIHQTPDGGYIVGGQSLASNGDVEGIKSAGFWIFKLDSSGNIEWEKNYGGGSIETFEQIQDGGYIIVGWTQLDSNGLMDCWVMKLSSLGNVKWVKNYGGRGWDRAKSVLQTIDGNFIIAGFSTSNSGDVRRNNGDSDAWIVKLNSDGNIVWEKNYGGSEDDYANSIKQTTDGGYIIAGSSQSTDGDASSNQGSSDIWVFKIVPQ